MERQLGWTTIEQSKKLIGLGIDINTADIWYQYIGKSLEDGSEKPIYFPTITRNCESNEDIPCWSFVRLIELMPEITILVRDSTGMIPSYFISIGPSESGEDIFMSEQYSTPIEAAVSTIIWLLENNYIKKEKQNELRTKI